ncbi:hypothetical protein [Actinomadura coerulea]|uniref:hypothetical protein n=1 Tax=Actinomadura coerulea TaxID=46159 RepID=UPI003F4E1E11
MDVKKLGNIPDGGGWRFVGHLQGERNRETTTRRTGARNTRNEPRVGTAFVHRHAWNHACAELGIRPKETRPYRP